MGPPAQDNKPPELPPGGERSSRWAWLGYKCTDPSGQFLPPGSDCIPRGSWGPGLLEAGGNATHIPMPVGFSVWVLGVTGYRGAGSP